MSSPENSRSDQSINRAGAGFLVSFCGGIFGKIASFVLRFFIIRFLGAKYFGFYTLAMVSVELIRIVASMGLPRGGMRFLSQALGEKKSHKIRYIAVTPMVITGTIGCLFGLAFYLCAEPLAVTWFGEQELVSVLKTFSILIPLMTILRASTDLSRGFFTTRYAVIVENIVVPCLQLSLFLALYAWQRNFFAIVAATIISWAAGSLLATFFLKKQVEHASEPGTAEHRSLSKREIYQDIISLVKYSLPLFATSILFALMGSLDVIMIGSLMDPVAVGIYSSALMIAMFAGTIFLASVNSIFAPLVAGHQGDDGLQVIGHLYKSTTRWIALLVVPLLSLIILFRETIMSFFGEEFLPEGAVVLVLLAMGQLVNCLTGGAGQILAMAGHPGKEFILTGLIILLNFALNLALIPSYGITGAATATMAAVVVINLLRVFVVYSIFRIQPFTSSLVYYVLLACFLMTGSLVSQVYLAVPVASGIGITAVLVLLGFSLKIAVDENDIGLLKQILQKRRKVSAA